MDTALLIRRQAEEQRNAVKELMAWQEGFGVKGAGGGGGRSGAKPKPAAAAGKPSSGVAKIKSQEYRKWDSFDVDKALEDVDYSPAAPSSSTKDSSSSEIPPPTLEEIEQALFEKEKGNAYFAKSKFKKAIQCYSQSIAFDNSKAIPFVNRCFAFIKLSQFEKAIEDASMAISLDPKSVKAYWRRGLAKMSMESYLEAKADLEFALVLEPTNSVIRKNLNEVELKLSGGKPESETVEVKEVKRRRIVITDINSQPKISPLAEGLDPAVVDKTTAEISPAAEVSTTIKGQMKETPKVPTDTPMIPVSSSPSNTTFNVQERSIDTLFEFEREWKSLKDDAEAKFKFLLQFSSAAILSIFKHSFETVYLSEFIKLANLFYIPQEKFTEVGELFSSISSIPRIKMVTMMLSKSDKEGLKSILSHPKLSHLKGVWNVKL